MPHVYEPLQAGLDHLNGCKIAGSDPFEVASASALLEVYDSYYDNDKYDVVSVEATQKITIPETKFSLTGRFDTFLRNGNGKLINLEHKTTASALDNPWHPQLAKTSFDRQISLYHLLAYLNGEMVEETWMDVIRKVSLRPKAIPAGTANKRFGSKREIVDESKYFGKELSQETLKAFRDDKLKKENAEMYRYRVLHVLNENPEAYFRRKTRITRTVDEMKEAFRQLVMVAKEIERAEETDAWYQNTNSCFAYGTTCPYWTICSGTDHPESDTWVPRKGSSQSGRFNLSHSRIGTFHSCRTKYYFTYVLGIEKAAREKSAALRYGSLVHDALEKYWLQQKELRNGNSGTSEV